MFDDSIKNTLGFSNISSSSICSNNLNPASDEEESVPFNIIILPADSPVPSSSNTPSSISSSCVRELSIARWSCPDTCVPLSSNIASEKLSVEKSSTTKLPVFSVSILLD